MFILDPVSMVANCLGVRSDSSKNYFKRLVMQYNALSIDTFKVHGWNMYIRVNLNSYMDNEKIYNVEKLKYVHDIYKYYKYMFSMRPPGL